MLCSFDTVSTACSGDLVFEKLLLRISYQKKKKKKLFYTWCGN